MWFGVVGCGCDGVDTGWASLSLYPQLRQNVAPSATCAPHFGQKLIDFWLYLFQCIAVTVAVGVGGYHNKVNDEPTKMQRINAISHLSSLVEAGWF